MIAGCSIEPFLKQVACSVPVCVPAANNCSGLVDELVAGPCIAVEVSRAPSGCK